MIIGAGLGFTSYEIYHVWGIVRVIKALQEEALSKANEPFPHNIPAINKVIRHTCQHLDIMADVTAYGILNGQDEKESFRDYKSALEDLRKSKVKDNRSMGNCEGVKIKDKDNDVRIRLLVFAPSLRLRQRPAQLGSDFLKKETNKHRLSDFYQQYPDLVRSNTEREEYIKGLDLDTLNNDLEKINTLEEKILEKPPALEIKFSTDDYMLFFWFRDGKEAAYEFAPPWLSSQELRTAMFVTYEKPQLDAFSEIFNAEWERGCSFKCIRNNDCTKDPPSCSSPTAEPARASR
jgi:hypothetical protein